MRDAQRWKQVLVSNAAASGLGLDPGTGAGNPSLIAAALREHPDVRGIFAVTAQLATDTVTALIRTGLAGSVKVYAVVDDDFNPSTMTPPTSPWVAVALTDPAQLAGAAVRATALRLAGQLPGSHRVFAVNGPAVRQDFIRQHRVDTLETLYPLLPAISGAPAITTATSSWLPNAIA